MNNNLERRGKRKFFIPMLGCAMLAAATLAVATSTSAVAQTSCGNTISTSTGPVSGIAGDAFVFPSTGTTGTAGTCVWLGIPYAAPPVGSLRWAPPQPHAPWITTLAATAYGSPCVTSTAGSENCLYLNVYAPAGATGLPVMAYIHGGGFIGGNGQGDYTLLASTGNVVVVSLNYRLNIFGFLAHAALGRNSGDYGLQDQQAALRWVQQNISAFGGDPHNVTIFGESAGGSSVCDAIASPTAAGLFHKAISASGEYNAIFQTPETIPRPMGTTLESQDCKSDLLTLAEAESIGAGFATAAGCASAANVAACLRALPTTTVFTVAGPGYSAGGYGTIGPTLNGTTLTMPLLQALKTGRVNRVPVIAGVDRDENLSGLSGVIPVTAADYTQYVEAQFAPIASQVLALYPLDRFGTPYLAWRTVVADSYTVCSALRTATALSRWMPVFEYEIDFGDVSTVGCGVPSGSATCAPTAANPAGASHVGEWVLTPEVSSKTAGGSGPFYDANRQVLQNQELAYVTTLARTGNPTADGTPVWPQFKDDGDHSDHSLVMSLSAGGDSEEKLVAQIRLVHHCEFWDEVSPSP